MSTKTKKTTQKVGGRGTGKTAKTAKAPSGKRFINAEEVVNVYPILLFAKQQAQRDWQDKLNLIKLCKSMKECYDEAFEVIQDINSQFNERLNAFRGSPQEEFVVKAEEVEGKREAEIDSYYAELEKVVIPDVKLNAKCFNFNKITPEMLEYLADLELITID